MATNEAAPDVRIGSVINLALGALGRHFLLFLGLTVLLFAVPLFLVGATIGIVGLNGAAGLSWALLPIWLVMLVASALLQASLVRATILHLDGQPVSFGAVTAVGFSMLPRLIGLSIIVGLGSALGMLLLIVPGVILYLMWSVAIPVAVQEGLGIGDSLRRSRELTAGVRWRIFGLYLVLGIGLIVLMMLAGAVLGAIFGPGAAGVITNLLSLLFAPLSAAVVAALYVELRRTREGVDVDQLAEVFA